MQKNDRFYTFLLSRTTKTTIYIRPVEVSKRLLHTGMVGLILSLGIVSLGISGVLPTRLISSPERTVLAAQQNNQVHQTPSRQITEPKSFNYSRPVAGDNHSLNSGGPAAPFRLTLVESEAEEIEIENQIRVIQTTSNPAFLPTMWAHLGKINNEFGFRRNPFGGRTYEFHAGLDIDGDRGDRVMAPANGIVIKAGWQGGYGNLVEIDHGNGLTTRYGHLSRVEVQAGDAVLRGQVLGQVGSTGRSTGPHLHYELRVGDKPINPRRLLPPEPAELGK